MKIAYILPSLVNTGPIVVVHNIIKYLISKVDLIDVYYFDKTPTILSFDCNVFQISKSDVIDFDKYDIIHSHTLWADVYLFRNRKKIKKAKTITTIHQDTFTCLTIQYNSIFSMILGNFWCYVQRNFDGVIAISDQLKNKYQKQLSGIERIYNGCTISEGAIIQPEIRNKISSLRDQGFRVLGSYASITKGKGLAQVINALPSLPEYIYVIFGEGPYLQTLKDTVIKLDLQDRVLFLPYIKAPYSYLYLIDIYMMPSYSEGFGLAMVEAALAGKSIVCSNLPSFHEIFTDEEVSFFELDNTDSLVQAITNAHLELDKKGELAYLKANAFFTAEIMATNHLHYYQKKAAKSITETSSNG